MKILGFGINAPKTYGKPEDKPDWWPKKPKWSKFRNPSKSSKEECTKLIRRLLEGHGIDADSYYINYPKEEDESESSSESSDEEDNSNANDNPSIIIKCCSSILPSTSLTNS